MPKALTKPQTIEVIDFTESHYQDIHTLLKEKVSQPSFSPCILIGEHPSVITLGRSQTSENNILIKNDAIPVVQTERGGDVTYHAPGQLVVYPLMELVEEQRDLHQHLRMLEEIVIKSLADIGLTGKRKTSYTGVWIGDKKVCSIGVAVKNIKGTWRSYHGLALNVCCDLAPFYNLNPCGLEASVMANVAEFLPGKDPNQIKEQLKQVLLDYTARYIRNEI